MNIISVLKKIINLNYDYVFNIRERQKAVKVRIKKGATGLPSPEEIYHAPYCFVLSTGRCGTGLLTKILAKSSNLLVLHSPMPTLEYASSLINWIKPPDSSLKIAILAARWDLFVDSFLRGRIYVETNNRITFFAYALASLFPNAKFIHLLRHPADFVRSGMRRGYYEEGSIQYQRLIPLDEGKWADMNRVEKIAWEWNEINLFIEGFKSTCGSSRIYTLKSENLFTQEGLVIEIFDFLNQRQPFCSINSIKKILKKPVNKQVAGDFPKYSSWSKQDKKRLKKIATLAFKYEYEFF